MSDNTELQRQQVDLTFLKETLDKVGIYGHLTPVSDESPLPFLSVQLGLNDQGDQAYIQMMYIPSAEIMDETNLLQFFAVIPEAGEGVTELPIPDSLFAALNRRTPLGYFGTDDHGQAFCRYVYALARYTPPEEQVFMEVIDMFTGVLTAFGSKILAYRRGQLTEAELLQQI